MGGNGSIGRYPQVQLTSGDLDGDNRDELVITSGYNTGAYNTLSDIIPRTTVWSMSKNESRISRKAVFDHKWDYKEYNSADTSGNVQYGAYGSAAVGDIDGDGANELVMAAYDVQADSLSNANGALYQEQADISIAKYQNGTYTRYAGGVGQSIKMHPNLASGMWDHDWHQPIALACFNLVGTGSKDLIFIAGMVYEFAVDSTEASYSGVALSSGHEAARYGYKLVHQTDKIFTQDYDNIYYGEKKDGSENIWLGTVAVGNFTNHENGGEQIIFEHGRKREGEAQYRHDMVIIEMDANGNFVSNYSCINNDISTPYRTNLDFAYGVCAG